jgi:hypothetical protein
MKTAARRIIAGPFLIGCNSSLPEIKGYGLPDQIKAIVFYGANPNGALDSGEAVTRERE